MPARKQGKTKARVMRIIAEQPPTGSDQILLAESVRFHEQLARTWRKGGL